MTKNIFQNARLKLTLIYLTIIVVINLFFSLNIYRIFDQELKRGQRSMIMRLPGQEIIIREIRNRLIDQLVLTNLIILVISGAISYFLAGETLKPIEKIMEDQKRFIGDASHELRTPLTAIKTETEVTLRDKKIDLKSAKQQLISNLEEIDKLKKLTDSLLKVDKMDFSNKKELINLQEVAQQVIKKMKIKAQLKGKNVKIWANKTAIEELLTILLDNAKKYGGKKIEVRIKPFFPAFNHAGRRTDKRGMRTVIEVKDDGIGINESDIPYIFNRFYRADASRTKNKADGYGLGLSIAKNIVDNMDGQIKVESKVEKGSVFKIII